VRRGFKCDRLFTTVMLTLADSGAPILSLTSNFAVVLSWLPQIVRAFKSRKRFTENSPGGNGVNYSVARCRFSPAMDGRCLQQPHAAYQCAKHRSWSRSTGRTYVDSLSVDSHLGAQHSRLCCTRRDFLSASLDIRVLPLRGRVYRVLRGLNT